MRLAESEKELIENKEKLIDEITEIRAQKEKLENDIKDWMSTAENNTILVNTLEQKIRQITSEKRDFELLLTKYFLRKCLKIKNICMYTKFRNAKNC